MRNRFVLDSNYEVKMLCNIQEPYDDVDQWRNGVVFDIDCDDTENQYIHVIASEGWEDTWNLTPGQLNTYGLGTSYWNWGHDTTIEFYKNNTLASGKTIYITFPDLLTGSGAVSSDYQIDGLVYLGQHYTMAGSYFSDAETIKDLTDKVDQAEHDIDTAQGDIITLQGDVQDNTEAIQNLQDLITISNVDITAGVTALGTGHVYLVYE